ncbi:MAG: flagellin FliC [Magnetococcales bacterium]|nr:flagellin FliC [Magnetococcales bacterium]
MLSINNSVTSLNAQRHLSRATGNLGKTFARLASGMRINSSRDDAAGMAIVNRMVAQVRGMNMAVRNANDGISLAQVAESALDETTNALQRARELMVQAANSTYSSGDRKNLQDEVVQMLSEVQRIATTTQFNEINLLTGSYSGNNFHVGADANQTIMFSIRAASLVALGVSMGGNGTATTLGSFGLGRTTAAAQSVLNSNLAKIDNALDSISDIRSNLGAVMSRFETVIASLSNVIENTDAARSRIQDADIATETAQLTRNTILQQAGVAILAQANQQPTIALQLLSLK